MQNKFLDQHPSHQGLGSGTQIALSTGILLSKFNNLNLTFMKFLNYWEEAKDLELV